MTLRNVLLLILLNVTFVFASDYYTAAVVEYHAKDLHWNTTQNVILNAQYHRSIISLVFRRISEQLDIIVFPETGLQDYVVENPVSTIIPSPDENATPCPEKSPYEYYSDLPLGLLEYLSCTAKMYKVYMVVNMMEKCIVNNKTHFYNTNVAFNRNGTIVGRYRKHNLYSTHLGLTKPSSPEVSYFDTDFGVRFGMFTCFDIVFKTPAVDLIEKYNITHFVFPTHWYSEMPFLTAIQAQYSWAASNNVVLLASGLNCPETGSSGSGIYIGSDNSPNSYVQTASPSDSYIIRKVPKNVSRGTTYDPGEVIGNSYIDPAKKRYLRIKSDKGVPSFNTELINENEALDCDSSTCRSSLSAVSKKICHGSEEEKFCCHFNYTLESFYENENLATVPEPQHDDFGYNYYRLVAFNGVKDYDGVAKGHIQLCAVLSCTDTSQNIYSCGNPTYNRQQLKRKDQGITYVKTRSKFTKLEISAKISDDAFSIMPNVLYSHNPKNDFSFGSLGPNNSFIFHKQHSPDSKLVYASIKIDQSIRISSPERIGVFGIYARISGGTEPSTNSAVRILSSSYIALSILMIIISISGRFLSN